MQNMPSPRSNCLSGQDLKAFAQANAPTDKLTDWRRHLRLCDRCAFRLAQVRAEMDSHAAEDGSANHLSHQNSDHLALSGLEPNIQLGDFRIEKRLGSGGMGVVYQAHQISLNRQVALKVLHLDTRTEQSAIKRFHREARAAARLHHPNIVAIHSVDEKEGICYYVMDKIKGRNLEVICTERRGQTFVGEDAQGGGVVETGPQTGADTEVVAEQRDSKLADILTTGQIDKTYFHTVAQLIADIADALDYAHNQGVIHRDVKPANIILDQDGHPILMDFGIARLIQDRSVSVTNSFVGTPQYMSPEQITGNNDQLDHRTDIYSLGATLYELLTRRSVLKPADSRERILYQMLHEDPPRPRRVDTHIPVDLESICCKAIEKDITRRYQTAGEFADDLRRYLKDQPVKAKPRGPLDVARKFVRRHRVAASLTFAMIVIALIAALITHQYIQTRWVHRMAVPTVSQHIKQDEYFKAFQLLAKADEILPEDPVLSELWPQVSKVYTITTSPSGAAIYCVNHTSGADETVFLGHAPLNLARIPFGTFRWRVQKQGFQTFEGLLANEWASPQSLEEPSVQEVHFDLHPLGQFPADMAWIPSSRLSAGPFYHNSTTIPDAPEFLIDKYEVTNRQFQEFVQGGGYQEPSYWQHEFVKAGQSLTWHEAMEQFRDATGQVGPAGWAQGGYPQDQDDYPVGGISWYEAAAYARFRDKDLPSVFHWRLAAIAQVVPTRICSISNFDDAPAPVGSHAGISPFGLYGVAGNVREWCHNAIQGQPQTRCTLGGAWGEANYMFSYGGARSCWDRDLKNGFRCVRYLGGKDVVPAEALNPIENKVRDLVNFKPISDTEYRDYIDTLYQYDPTALKAQIESVSDDLGFCRRETITYDAAYGGERILANLFLPKDVEPPYQVIIWFPGSGAVNRAWSSQLDMGPEKTTIINLIKSGRALIAPHYKLTYSRRISQRHPKTSIQGRDHYVQISKDLRRSIDYLETRPDINVDRLAYVGLSWGGLMGSVMIATEERIKTGIFLLGGICSCERHPATDPANFAPRVTVPILMINGRDDPVFPYESAQKPLFDLLGTPHTEKKHIVFPGGHFVLWEYRKQYNEKVTSWLDQCLGPVTKKLAPSPKEL